MSSVSVDIVDPPSRHELIDWSRDRADSDFFDTDRADERRSFDSNEGDHENSSSSQSGAEMIRGKKEYKKQAPKQSPSSAARGSASSMSLSTQASASSASAASDSALAEEEDYIRIVSMQGYVFDWKLEFFYFLLAICTCGASSLLGYWFPRVMCRYRYRAVSDMREAEYVQVISADQQADFIQVEKISLHPLAYEPHVIGKLWNGPLYLNDPIQHPQTFIPHSDRMILFRHNRFLLDPQRGCFVRQREPLQESSGVLKQRLQTGLSSALYEERQRLFGINQLQIVVPTYPALLLKELVNPFFIFQIYSVILWCFEAYYIFALCIAVIATVSIVTTLLETRSRLLNLSSLAKFEAQLKVLRPHKNESHSVLVQENSVNLVVGDIIEVENGIVPCDLSILSGGAVVNEAMLTGEAIPVIKTNVQLPLDQSGLVSLGIEARSTLYAATKVLQLKPSEPGGKVYGMVVRTGFATTKGALILSILFPKPSSFKFVEQSYKFIAALFGMALIGFGISIWQLDIHGAAVGTMIVRGLDLITIVVPPSLPLALSVGTNFALLALKAHKIFCISPNRINLAGKIQVQLLDKTGTLTSEGMELMGVLPSTNGSFATFHTTSSATDIPTESPASASNAAIEVPASISGGVVVKGGKLLHGWSSVADDPAREHLNADVELESQHRAQPSNSQPPLSNQVLSCMASCHAIASLDGELIGDPLEIEIYRATGANLRDTARDGFVSFISCPIDNSFVEIGVRVQFEFVPALQRMSVIVEKPRRDSRGGSEVRAFVKGSPEVMRTLCKPDTIPHDFEKVLREYAHKGYRIIAMGSKPMDDGIPVIEKEDLRKLVESDLQFLGLLVLENKVKPETAPTLQLLSNACVRPVMVSGDNPITCVSVAKECGLVPSHVKIFLASLVENSNTGLKTIEFIDTDDSPDQLKLNPRTLQIEGSGVLPPLKYELALTGSVFAYLEDRLLAESGLQSQKRFIEAYPADDDRQQESATRYFHRVILNSLVFARMHPDQKASLVSHLQAMGIFVAMCGDGSAYAMNTLETTKFGWMSMVEVLILVVLCEASIAAPFTYQRPNISCIPVLLSEGRSSLMTSFQLFKYMAMYSMVQFTAVIMLYFKGSVLGNWEYLLQDMFIVFPLTLFLGATAATPTLDKKRPSGNLLSAVNVANVLCHMMICLIFQIIVFTASQQQPDFFAYEDVPGFNNGPQTYESTSIYFYSNFQFICMAVLFARGAPWKASILTNFKFTAWTVLSVGVCLALLFSTHQGSFFRSEEVPIESHWRGLMFLILLFDVFANVVFNIWIFPTIHARYKRWTKTRHSQGTAYGKLKNTSGPNAKLWHRLRADFERNWQMRS